jgi:L-amino acid N-acyltransferase YncA
LVIYYSNNNEEPVFLESKILYNIDMNFKIRFMTPSDSPEVLKIYQEGIATGSATFETDVPTWDDWDRAHLSDARLVAEDTDGKLVGWAAVSPSSTRQVYAGVAEISIYVAESFRGRQVGIALLHRLIAASENAGIWMLTATIFAENKASISLHRRCGFRLVGRRERIAQLHGEWKDTVIYERRSAMVGEGEAKQS